MLRIAFAAAIRSREPTDSDNHHHQRDSAKLLPSQVSSEWQRSVGRINLMLESTGAEFDVLLSQIDDYGEGVNRAKFLNGDPLPATYALQKNQIEGIVSAIRSLKETYFRFQREL